MNYNSPRFSFVQFTPGDEPAECDFIYPVARNNDLAFQFTGSGMPGEISQTVNGTNTLYVVYPDAVLNNPADIQLNLLIPYSGQFSVTRVNATDVQFCWFDVINGIENIPLRTCFRLAVETEMGDVLISNCFQIVSEKYTSVLSFTGEEDSFGYVYCVGCENRIRLPLYLSQPQLSDTENVYLRSDGSRKLLSSVTSKSYQGRVDFIPFNVHEKIKIALSHDTVEIFSDEYSGDVVKDGSYDIGWTDIDDLNVAPASFKVFATPFDARNDNCAVCEPYNDCGEIDSLVVDVSMMPVVCATIDSLNVLVKDEDLVAPLSVILSIVSGELRADILGGVPPYVVTFYCIPSGTCDSYTIDAPSQNVMVNVATSAFTAVPYFGTSYDFYVDVTDANSDTASDGPNSYNACLIPTTVVNTEKSQKLICELKAGDMIEDEGGNYTEVTSVSEHTVYALVNINDGLLISSENHVHVIERAGKRLNVLANELTVGDKFFDNTGKRVQINHIVKMLGSFSVVNISTKSQTYIANGILTHNKISC